MSDDKFLLIDYDQPGISQEYLDARKQSFAMAFFIPYAEQVYGKKFSSISDKNLRNLEKQITILSLSDLAKKRITWSKYTVILAGDAVARYMADKAYTGIRDMLYRNVPVVPPGYSNPVTVWTLPSSAKINQVLTYTEEADNQEEMGNIARCVRAIFDHNHGNSPLSTMTKTVIVDSLADVDKLITYCEHTGIAVFDFETKPNTPGLTKVSEIKEHSLMPHLSRPTMLSVSFQAGSSYVIPLFHHNSPFDIGCNDSLYLGLVKTGKTVVLTGYKNGKALRRYNGTPIAYTGEGRKWFDLLVRNQRYCVETGCTDLVQQVIDRLKALFENPAIRNVAHNYKFDMQILKTWFKIGYCQGRQDDTMMMVHTIREDVEKSLKVTFPKYYPEFYGYGEYVDYANDDLNSLGHYAGVDTDGTCRICSILERKMLNDPLSYRVYRCIEVPKLRELSSMEHRGMDIDVPYLLMAKEQIIEQLDGVHNELMSVPKVQAYEKYVIDKKRKDKIDELLAKLERHTNSTAKSLTQAIGKKETKYLQTGKQADLAALNIAKRKLQAVTARKYHQDSYPYKAGRDYYRQWKSLCVGESNIDFQLSFKSSTQMGDLLYISPVGYMYDMPVVARKIVNPETKRRETIVGKHPSTDKDELGKLDDKDGFVNALLEYRLLSLLKSTYLDGIYDRMDDNNRVHSRYSTIRSQRLASTNPNLQNIPSRTKLKRVKEMVAHVKRMFVPKKGVFFQVDLSQAELRYAAYLWNVRTMISAFQSDKDLHVLASAASKGWSYEKWFEYEKTNPEDANYMRFQGKADNFGLIYAMSPESYREYNLVNYGIVLTKEEAEKKHHNYLYRLHPDIPVAHQRYKDIGREKGFVRTAFGSKRYVPAINSKNSENRSHDERVCLNSPVQGSSGQGLLFSLIVFSDYKTVLDLEGSNTNTVHDSIIGWVEERDKNDYLRLLLQACNHAPTREYFGFNINDTVPMVSDAETGDNWKDLTKFES